MTTPKNTHAQRRNATALLVLTVLCIGLNQPALATNTLAQKPPKLEYASPDQSVWTTKITPNGEPDNPLLKLASALFDKAGIDWQAKIYPASRMFTNLQNGSAQFSMLVKSPALQACCLISAKPITSAEIRAYYRDGTPPVKAKEDLVNKQVIMIRGYSYGGLAQFFTDERNHITTNVTQAHASAFRMLENGRADYLIDYAGPANEVLLAQPINGLHYDVLSRQDIYLVLSKTYPDAHNVMAKLERIAAALDVEAILGNKTSERKTPSNKGP